MQNTRRPFRGKLKKLPRSFYLRPTVIVARDLLGKYFVRRLGRRRLVGRIVEAEAYREKDPASHSFRGLTERNKIMFSEGGHLYVYFTYGMHFCSNVVSRAKGVGEAVLIRAVEPVEGVDIMKRKRGLTAGDVDGTVLTNGPAKFCEAFGITRGHNGIDLCGSEIFLAASSTPKPPFRIRNSSRVGVRHGKEKKWRFYADGNRFVSPKYP